MPVVVQIIEGQQQENVTAVEANKPQRKSEASKPKSEKKEKRKEKKKEKRVAEGAENESEHFLFCPCPAI